MVKISLEGLPGCKKDLIYHILREEHGFQILTTQNAEMFELYLSDPSRYGLTFEIDQLIRANDNFTKSNQIVLYDSLHALKEVYVEYLMNTKILNRYEVEIFHKLHHILQPNPDVIIYLHGDLEKCYERSKSGAKNYTLEEFKNLYAQYEWVFDQNNCHIKIFKVNMEEDLALVVKTILHIFSQIQEKSNDFQILEKKKKSTNEDSDSNGSSGDGCGEDQELGEDQGEDEPLGDQLSE